MDRVPEAGWRKETDLDPIRPSGIEIGVL